MEIKIAQVKKFRELLGMTHLIVFAVDSEGRQYVATHGKTQQHAKEAADTGNKLKLALGWPESLCNCKPLPRIHKNCAYYKPDYGIWCMNGWSGDGSSGYCYLETKKTHVVGDEIACRHFEPKV